MASAPAGATGAAEQNQSRNTSVATSTASPPQPVQHEDEAGYMHTVKLGANRLREVGSHIASQARPWDEIFDRSAYDRPASIGEATGRVKKNASHFKVNYLIFVGIVLALCMLFHPSSLVWLVALLFGWIYLFLVRSEPITVNGRELSEREKAWGAAGVTLMVVMVTNVGTVLFSAIGLALTGIAIHGSLRVPDDLFLDENEDSGSILSFLKPPAYISGGSNV